MSDEITQEGNAGPGTGVRPGLWIGFLAPPVVWAVQMQLNYWAVRGACARGGNGRLLIVTVTALLFIVLSGLCAWASKHDAAERRRVDWGAVVSSSGFMFALGLLSCTVFFIAVLAQGIGILILHPCQQ